MSEHSKILEKYEEMFKNGSAYKPIQIEQPRPDNMLQADRPDTPLGDPINRSSNVEDPPPAGRDYSQSDAYIEGKINEMRNNRNMNDNTQNVIVQNNEFEALKKRVDLMEQALSLVMETQTKLIKS